MFEGPSQPLTPRASRSRADETVSPTAEAVAEWYGQVTTLIDTFPNDVENHRAFGSAARGVITGLVVRYAGTEWLHDIEEILV